MVASSPCLLLGRQPEIGSQGRVPRGWNVVLRVALTDLGSPEGHLDLTRLYPRPILCRVVALRDLDGIPPAVFVSQNASSSINPSILWLPPKGSIDSNKTRPRPDGGERRSARRGAVERGGPLVKREEAVGIIYRTRQGQRRRVGKCVGGLNSQGPDVIHGKSERGPR